MKKIIPLIFILVISQSAFTQQPGHPNNPYPKTISVSGSAEMDIIPDEIYVHVELGEYQKKGEAKKDIESIKSGFLASCKAVGIADSSISIVSYSGNNRYYNIRKRKKDQDMMASITYQVKFRSSRLMDDLVEKLDDDATRDFRINAVSHSQMAEFRRLLKIQAVQAAKEKGIYLTEAIGEKLGEAISLSEPVEWIPPQNVRLAIRGANSVGSFSMAKEQVDDASEEINFKTIKLRFEVNAVFAIK
jgi:uncharacterized protein YggE